MVTFQLVDRLCTNDPVLPIAVPLLAPTCRLRAGVSVADRLMLRLAVMLKAPTFGTLIGPIGAYWKVFASMRVTTALVAL